MGDIRKQRFIETLRSSPRKRRRATWLAGSVVALATLVVLAVVILPNSAGKPKPAAEAVAPQQGGDGPFWIVSSILLIGFLAAIVFVVVRFVWRMHKDEVDDAARPGAYAFPNTRLDPDELAHPSPE